MSVARLFSVIAAATLWLPLHLPAQAAPKNAAGPKSQITEPAEQANNAQDLIPKLDLQFKAGDPIPGITASPLIASPIQCSGDGAALLHMLIPPDVRESSAYLVHPTKATEIQLKSIPGLSKIQLINLFASHSLVGALINAWKVTGETPKDKDYGYFIATFDPNGQFLSTIEIPVSYQVIQFAILASGDFVIFGYDPTGSAPRLWLLDSSGEIKRPIQLSDEVQDAIKTEPKDKKLDGLSATIVDSIRGSQAFGMARFTSYGEKVIFWDPRKKSVLEIGNGGSVREVQIESPKGYEFDGFIPSNDRWIVQFKRSGLPQTGEIDIRPETQNIIYYEVTASDGTLRRKLSLGSGQNGWTACEHDGVLLGFKTDDKQHLIPVTAELGK